MAEATAVIKTSPQPLAMTKVRTSAVMEIKPMAMANWVKGVVSRGGGLTYEKTFTPTLYNAQLPRGTAEAKSGRKTVKQLSVEQERTYHPRARASMILAMETPMDAQYAVAGKKKAGGRTSCANRNVMTAVSNRRPRDHAAHPADKKISETTTPFFALIQS